MWYWGCKMLNEENLSGKAYLESRGQTLSVDGYFHVQKSVLAMKSIWTEQARKNNTRIETVFDKNVPNVLPINAMKFQHCLNNLAANAVNSTIDGLVRVIVSRLDKPHPKYGTQSYLLISVQDTGPGISAGDMASLFVRKSDTATQNGVTYGVVDTGLPMTQSLITEMGGKILVKSEIGKGSTFSLVLPLANSSFENKSVSIGSRFYDMNVLVVDDYNLNHLTLKALLQDSVVKIFTASHGYEALEILHSCPIDLIFMDIHMPIMDGIETTLKIRESDRDWSGVHIVAMTADPDYQHMHLCKKIGIDAALAKPFRIGAVYAILEDFAPAYKIATTG